MKPILFSTPMVQAIMAGRKTQTRRVIKFPNDYTGGPVWPNGQFGVKYESQIMFPEVTVQRLHPPHIAGDILYVREKFRELVDCQTGKFHSYDYYADMPEDFHKQYPHKWAPSLFMPKKAARLFLEVTEVRAERLHTISNTDAVKEGAPSVLRSTSFEAMRGSKFVFPKPFLEFQFGFMALWCKINGVESWDSNPWVWVYSFKKIDKP